MGGVDQQLYDNSIGWRVHSPSSARESNLWRNAWTQLPNSVDGYAWNWLCTTRWGTLSFNCAPTSNSPSRRRHSTRQLWKFHKCGQVMGNLCESCRVSKLIHRAQPGNLFFRPFSCKVSPRLTTVRPCNHADQRLGACHFSANLLNCKLRNPPTGVATAAGPWRWCARSIQINRKFDKLVWAPPCLLGKRDFLVPFSATRKPALFARVHVTSLNGLALVLESLRERDRRALPCLLDLNAVVCNFSPAR